MLRTRLIFACLLLSSLPLFSEAELAFAGGLVFGVNGKLQYLDMGTNELTVLIDKPREEYLHLSKVDEKRILHSSGGEIFLLDLETRKSTVLGRGYKPLFIPATNKIAYVRGNGKVYITSLNDFLGESKQIGDETLPDGDYPILATGPILLFQNKVPQGGPWRYDIALEKLDRLTNLSDCRPLFWRSRTRELICANRSGSSYYLSDLEGKKREGLPSLDNVAPINYIEELDSVVFSRRNEGIFAIERRDIFLYDFASRRTHPVRDFATLSIGSVAYFEKRIDSAN